MFPASYAVFVRLTQSGTAREREMACIIKTSPRVHPAILAALQGDTGPLSRALEGKKLPRGQTPLQVAERMRSLRKKELWRQEEFASLVRSWM